MGEILDVCMFIVYILEVYHESQALKRKLMVYLSTDKRRGLWDRGYICRPQRQK